MHRALILAVLIGAALSSGCGNVAPWQRAKLAHPTMAPEAGASVGREHMQAVHEGATGGGITVESGCGCN